EGVKIVRSGGVRSLVIVPMRRNRAPVGTILIARPSVGAFSKEQISLLQTFADQAVIAIENVRLFNETKEALERQTATAEILRAIGTSPTEARPVFEAIARNSVRVCGALGCGVFVVDGDMVHLVATHGVRPERLEKFRSEYPAPLASHSEFAPLFRERC